VIEENHYTIEIQLEYPFKSLAGEVSVLHMRRPKMRDMRQLDKMNLSKGDLDLYLITRLAQEKLTIEDLEEMDFADYAKVLNQFQDVLRIQR
jgi:hypothetical protein